MKTFVRVMLMTTACFAATVGGAFPLGGCGSDDGETTTGKRISLGVRIAATPESREFTNAAGWKIEVDKAYVATGAFYYFDGATLFARSPERFRLVRHAHAHPGHYVPGNAKGEMLTASSADLLAGADLGQGAGVSGPVRSATFSFDTPAKGPMASELGDNVIVVEATGTKGTETRIIRAEIKADEVRNANGAIQIEGCPFVEADMQSDGVVSVGVKLTLWFDQIELDAVPASTDGKPVLLTDGLARNQLVRGVKAGVGYVFSYSKS